MTITLNLTPDEEAQLHTMAARRGVQMEEYVLDAVKKLLPLAGNESRVAALRTLLDDDEAEQRETGEYLLRALDEDRLSNRKLFP